MYSNYVFVKTPFGTTRTTIYTFRTQDEKERLEEKAKHEGRYIKYGYIAKYKGKWGKIDYRFISCPEKYSDALAMSETEDEYWTYQKETIHEYFSD